MCSPIKGAALLCTAGVADNLNGAFWNLWLPRTGCAISVKSSRWANCGSFSIRSSLLCTGMARTPAAWQTSMTAYLSRVFVQASMPASQFLLMLETP